MFPGDSTRSASAMHTTSRRTAPATERHWLDDEPESTRPFSRPPLSDVRETVTLQGRVELLEVIGEGGMSLVHSATQVGLERRVAVKMLPEDERGSLPASELVREAIVTGMLEHPNIVPVYAAGHAEDGSPALVMKHIEGTLWGDTLADPDHSLDRHIEVLMTVCRAVHFAHTKGIVHRDIKPDNVMLGDLGEIYVLDWGLAVTTRDDLPPVVPHAVSVSSPAGTPAYWAPEMALGLQVDERTDVYLLGAVLHQIITGDPPHFAESVHEAVISAVSRDAKIFSDDTPTELAAICRQAMAYEPALRFDTVEELRVALVEFLQHRASLRLAEVAEARVSLLLPMMAGEDPDTTLVHKLYTEARFAFKQALREWEDNAEARFGLQRLLEKMADFHIRRGSYDLARALVDELMVPRTTLDQRLISLVDTIQKRNSEIDQLRQLRDDNDVRVGKTERRRLWLAVGAWLTLSTLGVGSFAGFDFARGGYAHVWIIIGVTLLGLFGSHSYIGAAFKNGINRRIHRTLYGFIFVAQLTLAACQLTAVPFNSGMTLFFATLAGAATMVAIAFHRRFMVMTFTYLVGTAAIAMFPSHGFLIMAATFAGAMAVVETVEHRLETMRAKIAATQLKV